MVRVLRIVAFALIIDQELIIDQQRVPFYRSLCVQFDRRHLLNVTFITPCEKKQSNDKLTQCDNQEKNEIMTCEKKKRKDETAPFQCEKMTK